MTHCSLSPRLAVLVVLGYWADLRIGEVAALEPLAARPGQFDRLCPERLGGGWIGLRQRGPLPENRHPQHLGVHDTNAAPHPVWARW